MSEVEIKIQQMGNRSGNVLKVMDYLYQKPVIKVAKVAEITETSDATAYSLVNKLEKLGILKEITGGKRKKTFIYADYINLFYV